MKITIEFTEEGAKLKIKFTEEEAKLKEVKSLLEKSNINYVDLGLPSKTLWADRNIGAKKPEDYGEYYNFDAAQKYNCPTKEQFKELVEYCDWKWVTYKNTNGYLVIGKNGNSIFLPAGGHFEDDLCCNDGRYWSSTLYNSTRGHSLDFVNGDYVTPIGSNRRYYGFSVRSVKNNEDNSDDDYDWPCWED